MLAAALLLAAGGQGSLRLRQEFAGKDAGKEWMLSNAAWKVAGGVLQGPGAGHLECALPLQGDFSLTFEAETREKANVEVKLLDARGEKALYTFAFLGRYHSVLDGVKSAILKGDKFVKVSSRMWIFPGRTFKFEVRRLKNKYLMLLDGEAGPELTDEEDGLSAAAPFRVRIELAPEGEKDGVKLDNVAIEGTQAEKQP